MKQNINRRHVLLGIGGTAAASGAVFGSGAFTQVEAGRGVSISVDDDSGSTAQLMPGASPDGSFASIAEDTNGALEINLANEALNTDALLTVGDSSVASTDLDSSPEAQEVAFIIQDNSTFTDTDTNALGVTFEINSDTTLDEISFGFSGDSDNSALDNTAGTGDGGTDFSTLSGSTASTGSVAGDQTAEFVLNTNSPGSSSLADGYSGVAAAVVTVDTTSNSGTHNLDLTATVSAERVTMQ